MDYIGASVFRGARPGLTDHLEFWAGHFQFSSNTTLLYWVPQQALAAWLMTALVLEALLHPHDLRYLGLSLAAGLLWSPLGLVGLLPYGFVLAIAYLAPARRPYLLRPVPLVAHGLALVLAILIGLYLSANRFQFPSGWIWQGAADPARLWQLYAWFWCLEFGLLALLLGLVVGLSSGLRRFDLNPPLSAALAVSGLTLTLLPLHRLGYNNDLAMRASIPSLWILWIVTGRVLLGALPAAAQSGSPLRLRAAYLLLVGVVLLGARTSLSEMARSIRFYHFGPPPLESVVAMADADRPHLVEQRVGDPEALFFRYLAR
jgi:hypothetical protein